jgi:UrcA family protein
MEETMKCIALAPAAFVMALAVTPAAAQLPDQSDAPRALTFSVSDLDLATPKGQKELDWRISRAIREVCQTTAITTGTRVMSPETRACITEARASIKAQVAQITAEQSQKGG